MVLQLKYAELARLKVLSIMIQRPGGVKLLHEFHRQCNEGLLKFLESNGSCKDALEFAMPLVGKLDIVVKFMNMLKLVTL